MDRNQQIIDQAMKSSGIRFISDMRDVLNVIGFDAFGLSGVYINPDENPHVPDAEEIIAVTISKDHFYYMSCFLHELVHSTRRQGRCYRNPVKNESEITTEILVEEELTAEKGAMILMKKLGFEQTAECLAKNERYMKGYLEMLSEKDRFDIEKKADVEAERAAKWIIENWLPQEKQAEKPSEAAV